MTKANMIKEVRDVMTGVSGHTNILVWKKGRSWKTETNISKFSFEDVDNVNGFQLNHCCNEMTLKETENYLKDNYLI